MRKELTTIRGIIIPSSWDKEGRILKVAISTFDENMYHVNNFDIHGQLHAMLRKEVEIRGLVSEKTGHKSISVHEINLL